MKRQRVEWEFTPLTQPMFSSSVPDDLKLTDPVLCYSDGRHDKIVPLKVAKHHPLIYDLDYHQREAQPITVSVCPIALNPVVFHGEIGFTGQITDRGIVVTDGSTDYHQFTGTEIGGEKLLVQQPVILDTLRNIIQQKIDPQFLTYSGDYSITPSNWNDFPPHQLAYGIRYRTITEPDHRYKATLIHPRRNIIDSRGNGFQKYLDTYLDRIRDREGVVHTTYFDRWVLWYPDSKVIKL